MSRRLLSVALSIVMALTVMSVPAFASEEDSGTTGAAASEDVQDIQNESDQSDPDQGDAEVQAESSEYIEDEASFTASGAELPEVTGVKVTADGSGNAEITWTSVSGAAGYEIFRSAEKTADDAFASIGRTEDASAVSFTDSGLENKTLYLYKVRAFTRDSSGSEVYGAFSEAVFSGKAAKKIPVITYHRICKDSAFSRIRQGRSQFVKAGVFAKEMKYLNDRGYRTISTDEFYDWHAGNTELPEKVVLVTFDDGNYSVIKYGLPVLKKYKQKATIFMIGCDIRSTTKKGHYSADSYYYIGKDVMKRVKKTYPSLEFQSHTYRLHSKVNGKRPVRVYSTAKLYKDAVTQYRKFGFTALAYPWGTTNSKMIKALKKEGHIKVAFTYGRNAYARRSNNRYKVSRIKIYGTQPFSYFTRWF